VEHRLCGLTGNTKSIAGHPVVALIALGEYLAPRTGRTAGDCD